MIIIKALVQLPDGSIQLLPLAFVSKWKGEAFSPMHSEITETKLAEFEETTEGLDQARSFVKTTMMHQSICLTAKR